MRYEFDAVLHVLPDNGGAYVAFPGICGRNWGKAG